jgi:adenylate kinase
VVVVLLGPPGAGKGTQAPIVAERLGVPILASGDLLRAVAISGSEIGRDVDAIMRSGSLVPDETIVRIFLDRLLEPDAARGAILDGFPRTAAQAGSLDVALASVGARVDAAILIEVPESELMARMTERLLCRGQGHVYNLLTKPPQRPGICDIDGSELYKRVDDAEETVRARLEKQLAPLAEVVAHYRAAGVLSAVDGRQAIAGVTADVMAALNAEAADAATA